MCRAGGSDGADGKIAVEYNTIDLGLYYRMSESIGLGLTAKNILGFSLKRKYDTFALPRYVTLGAAIRWNRRIFSLDHEFIFGRFGGLEKQTAEIWLLRAGLEQTVGRFFKLRAGLIYPVLAKTSSLGDLKSGLPWPKLGGSIGLGLALKRFNIDLALYGDIAKSYVTRGPVPGATGTLTYKF